MALNFPPVAGIVNESFTPSIDMIGDADVITQTATIASGAGVVVYLQVLGLVTASGKLVKHNPAGADGSQNATALAAYGVDATSGDVVCQVITAGEFAVQSLTFNAATNTDALKLAVFGLNHPIKVKKAIYSAA